MTRARDDESRYVSRVPLLEQFERAERLVEIGKRLRENHGVKLPASQIRVVRALLDGAAGNTNLLSVADECGLTPGTVKGYLVRMYQVLAAVGVYDLPTLMLWAERTGEFRK